jgi:hypothetical protein
MFGVALELNDEIVGVAVADRPIARMLDDGLTIEITRVCVVDGHLNACSMLYGALCRAAQALGFERAVTYTLANEDGASVKAAGFRPVANVSVTKDWTLDRGRPLKLHLGLVQVQSWPDVPKIRWQRDLVKRDSVRQEEKR